MVVVCLTLLDFSTPFSRIESNEKEQQPTTRIKPTKIEWKSIFSCTSAWCERVFNFWLMMVNDHKHRSILYVNANKNEILNNNSNRIKPAMNTWLHISTQVLLRNIIVILVVWLVFSHSPLFDSITQKHITKNEQEKVEKKNDFIYILKKWNVIKRYMNPFVQVNF